MKTLRDLDLAIINALKIRNPEAILEKLYSDLILELDRTEIVEEEEKSESNIMQEQKIIKNGCAKAVKLTGFNGLLKQNYTKLCIIPSMPESSLA